MDKLIIRGATLIDGTGAPPRGPVDIVIEKNRITQVADVVGAPARAQLAAEVIFLTHNERLHEVNLGWHP